METDQSPAEGVEGAVEFGFVAGSVRSTPFKFHTAALSLSRISRKQPIVHCAATDACPPTAPTTVSGPSIARSCSSSLRLWLICLERQAGSVLDVASTTRPASLTRVHSCSTWPGTPGAREHSPPTQAARPPSVRARVELAAQSDQAGMPPPPSLCLARHGDHRRREVRPGSHSPGRLDQGGAAQVPG